MAREADLDEHQRAYVLAIFELDQAAEADARQLPYHVFQPRPKEAAWRWLEDAAPAPEPARRSYS
jgi:hypothetical protein